MGWYKIVFRYLEAFPDFRVVYADNIAEATKKFKDYWDNREGFKIISILDNCTQLPVIE